MIQRIKSLCVLLCASSLVLLSEAQFFDTGASSLGSAPVGFIDRFGEYGDRENIASLGMAPVGVYRRQEYPLQTYYPRMPLVEAYPLVRPSCQLPGPCPYPLVRPVRPPVKFLCQLAGSCPDQVHAPKTFQPPPPLVRVKPDAGRKRPKKPMRTKKPMRPKKPRMQESKPEDVEGRVLGAPLKPVLGVLGGK